MRGILKSEQNSCSNPIITFFYQKNGFLQDIAELTFQIVEVSTGTTIIAETTVDVSNDCPTGHRLSVGRYVAPFDPATFNTGTHQIIWKYRETASGNQYLIKEYFEVLDQSFLGLSTGASFVGYVTSKQLIDQLPGLFASTEKAQEFIYTASRRIEELTSRHFHPVYSQHLYDTKQAPVLPFGDPIIGIEAVGVYDGTTFTPFDSRSVLVYNRHINGLLHPDDRDYPRVEIQRGFLSEPNLFLYEFPNARQMIQVKGVFGYTDPDGTFRGRTPLDLERATIMLVHRLATDPTGSDVFTSSASLIRSAKTRDQSVSFFKPSETGGSIGILTGDPAIDMILSRYVRPIDIMGVL